MYINNYQKWNADVTLCAHGAHGTRKTLYFAFFYLLHKNNLKISIKKYLLIHETK